MIPMEPHEPPIPPTVPDLVAQLQAGEPPTPGEMIHGILDPIMHDFQVVGSALLHSWFPVVLLVLAWWVMWRAMKPPVSFPPREPREAREPDAVEPPALVEPPLVRRCPECAAPIEPFEDLLGGLFEGEADLTDWKPSMPHWGTPPLLPLRNHAQAELFRQMMSDALRRSKG